MEEELRRFDEHMRQAKVWPRALAFIGWPRSLAHMRDEFEHADPGRADFIAKELSRVSPASAGSLTTALRGYAPGRGAEHADKLYAGIRRGTTLVTDGYQVYDRIGEVNGLTHLGCWVHVRRAFIKAEKAIPKAAWSPNQLATRFNKLIGRLYRAESLAEEWTPAASGAATHALQRRGGEADRATAAREPAYCAAIDPAGQGAALSAWAVAHPR